MAALRRDPYWTVLGPGGRPERTEYADGEVERYHYDAAGTLVAIGEAPSQWRWCDGSERLQTGGRLTVTYEAGELAWIHGENATVWERPPASWPDRLASAAETIAASVTADLDEVYGGGDDAMFALYLTYVDQGSLHLMLNVGFEQGRRELLESVADLEERTIELLYLSPGSIAGGPSDYLESDLPDALDIDLLRDACIAQPDDPYRVPLGAVARVISDRGLGPSIATTDDFVVYIAEHDEGIEEKVDSIHRHNAPERVDRWRAGWQGERLPVPSV